MSKLRNCPELTSRIMKLDRNVDPGHRVARHSREGGNPGLIALDSRLRGNDTDAPNTEIISGLFLNPQLSHSESIGFLSPRRRTIQFRNQQ